MVIGGYVRGTRGRVAGGWVGNAEKWMCRRKNAEDKRWNFDL